MCSLNDGMGKSSLDALLDLFDFEQSPETEELTQDSEKSFPPEESVKKCENSTKINSLESIANSEKENNIHQHEAKENLPPKTRKVSDALSKPEKPPSKVLPPSADMNVDLGKQPKFSADKEAFTGLPIKNRLVSSETLQKMMLNKKFIAIENINSSTLGDWVTLATLIEKSSTLKTSQGKPFMIWKLSDLKAHQISFMLFGDVYKTHWKMELGSIVACLNPVVKPARNGFKGYTLDVQDSRNIIKVGTCSSLGVCKAVLKGPEKKPCKNPVNLAECEYCDYHVAYQYSKMRSSRMEFNKGAGTPIFKGMKQKPSMAAFGYPEGVYAVERPKLKQLPKKEIQEIIEGKDGKAALLGSVSGKRNIFKTLGYEKEQRSDGKVNQMQFSQSLTRGLGYDPNTEPGKANPNTMKSIHKAGDILKEMKIQKQQRNDMMPRLGRGFGPGDEIRMSFESSHEKNIEKKNTISASIEKVDPNSTKKRPCDVKALLQRIEECKRQKTVPPHESEEVETSREGPLKPSDIMGKLSRESIEKLKDSKSIHAKLIEKEDMDHLQKGMQALEKKEKMAEKMAKIFTKEITVFHCNQCKTTVRYLSTICQKEKHHFHKTKALLRWFACKECSHRIETIEKFPVHSCEKCKADNWKAVSMFRERKKIEGVVEEKFLTRGVEHPKFLNG